MQKKKDDKSQARNEILKSVVASELKPAKIVHLKSEKAEDHDGDPIMRIRVVYESDDNRLDPNKTLGLSRVLCNRYRKIFAKRYPVFYFLTKEEDALASN